MNQKSKRAYKIEMDAHSLHHEHDHSKEHGGKHKSHDFHMNEMHSHDYTKATGYENPLMLHEEVHDNLYKIEKSRGSCNLSDISSFTFGASSSRFWMYRK